MMDFAKQEKDFKARNERLQRQNPSRQSSKDLNGPKTNKESKNKNLESENSKRTEK
jgi:hypothetical protein